MIFYVKTLHLCCQVLVNPGKHPYMTEKMLTGCKASAQAKINRICLKSALKKYPCNLTSRELA